MFSEPCPDLAHAIETGADEGALRERIEAHVTALSRRIGRPPDRAILGCTHYEIAADLFRAALPPGAPLIHQPDATADAIERYLARHPEYARGNERRPPLPHHRPAGPAERPRRALLGRAPALRARLKAAGAPHPPPAPLPAAPRPPRLLQPRGGGGARHPADALRRHPGTGEDPGRASRRPQPRRRHPHRRRRSRRPARRRHPRRGRGAGPRGARRGRASGRALPPGRDPHRRALPAARRPAPPARGLSHCCGSICARISPTGWSPT